MGVFGILADGDTHVSLGRGNDSARSKKRALHRLAVLGVIGDYCVGRRLGERGGCGAPSRCRAR